MVSDPEAADLEIVFDWMNALRRGDVDSIAEYFRPDVIWETGGGHILCAGRDQVLDSWRRRGTQRPPIDAVELVARDRHVLFGVQDHVVRELPGLLLEGQHYLLFTIEGGQVARLRTYGGRSEALAAGAMSDHRWR